MLAGQGARHPPRVVLPSLPPIPNASGLKFGRRFKDVADYEQWEWTKADTENVVQRRAIEDYMTWEGAFGKNRKWASGKTYK